MSDKQNTIAEMMRARAAGDWSDSLRHIPEALYLGAAEIDRLQKEANQQQAEHDQSEAHIEDLNRKVVELLKERDRTKRILEDDTVSRPERIAAVLEIICAQTDEVGHE